MPFLSGWTRQKAITIPAAYITGGLTNFPLSVQFTNDAQIGAAALASGNDLRFTLSDGTTVCPCYRRSFSITGGQATGIYDVLVPSLTSGVAGNLICQYGNANASDVSNAAAVWGSSGAGFTVAYTCGDGTTVDLTDLSGSGNNGTNVGATATTGILGGATNHSGASKYFKTINPASLTSFSVGIWAKRTDNVQRALWGGYNAATLSKRWYLRHEPGGYLRFAAGNDTIITTGTPFTQDLWRRIICTWNESEGIIYVNGSSVSTRGSGMTTDFFNFTAPFGAFFNAADTPDVATNLPFVGAIDEPQVKPVAISAAWASLDYNQIANQSSVVTWGSEVSTTTTRLERGILTGGRLSRQGILTGGAL